MTILIYKLHFLLKEGENESAKFIAIQAYLKKQEKSQINNLTLQLKSILKRLAFQTT